MIALGWNVVETQKKKKVTEMLQTAVGQGQQAETKVLIDAGADGLRLDAVRQPFQLRQEAGGANSAGRHDDEPEYASAGDGVCAIPGALIGAKFKAS